MSCSHARAQGTTGRLRKFDGRSADGSAQPRDYCRGDLQLDLKIRGPVVTWGKTGQHYPIREVDAVRRQAKI